jgi:hypothetical protein
MKGGEGQNSECRGSTESAIVDPRPFWRELFLWKKQKNDRQAKSCGKDGQKTPLEIKKRFPLFAQLQQQQA